MVINFRAKQKMATDCRHSGRGAILCEDAGSGEACCPLHTLRGSTQTRWGLAPRGEQRPASGRGTALGIRALGLVGLLLCGEASRGKTKGKTRVF